MKKILLILVLFALAFSTKAQTIDNATVMQLVAQNATAIGLQKDQASNLKLSSAYSDAGIQYVYLLQTYKGVPIYNQMLVLSFRNNKLLSHAGTLLTNLEKNAQSASPSIQAASAVSAAFSEAKIAPPANAFAITTKENGRVLDFGKLPGVTENVVTELMWLPDEKTQNLKLIWQVQVAPVKKADIWLMHVDATNSSIAGKLNLTVFEKTKTTGPGILAAPFTPNQFNTGNATLGTTPPTVTSAGYRVIPFPYESPSHHAFQVVNNPWVGTGAATNDAFTDGWHFDGTTNYDITRGNNVHAYLDVDANNTPNQGGNNFSAQSTTAIPTLTFNFTQDPTLDPSVTVNKNAAVTSLFYWNNLMHDVTYQYGFNEVAGNFQTDNLSRGGLGNDYVQAEAQDASGTNNANFGTPVDGNRPRMQMFLFDAVASVILKVNTPASIAGNYTAVESAFSTANKLAAVGPVTGQVVNYNDDGTPTGTHFACNGTTPGSLTGKIVLITRGGGCAGGFVEKVKNAQINGAAAVIMINNVSGAPIIMGGTDNTITIPAVMISDVDGATFTAQLANNLNATLSGTAGVRLDGDLDAGVMCHEYGHGVSNRFTGGPANVSCLGNAEEGGEGWSDYGALMMTTNWATALVTDGNKPRPMGIYVEGQPVNGAGIRRYPYSTDMAVNPWTYSGVQTSGGEVHDIGEIWCATIWDMTWAIIQQENAINPNLYNYTGTGGNSIALKLVYEGMKLQPCSPGFLDARNAIIQADQNLFGGAHFCTIWSAFARRGMGYSAVQGSSNSTADQVQAFDMPPVGQFTSQPQSTTVCLTNPVTFSVTTSGTVTYQWQVLVGTTWTNIAGATTASYTFTPIAADNGSQYRVVITGQCGAVPSNAATLTTTTAAVGGTLSPATTNNVCVGATGNSTTLTLSGQIGNIIRWESSTDGGTNWVQIANTTTTYTATNLTQTTIYRVVVQATGCAAVFSSTATINVVAGIGGLAITANQGSTLCQGDPTLLTVIPAGAPCVSPSGNINVTIPDDDPTGVVVSQTINCATPGATLTGVSVTLNITHTWDGDLTLSLKSPTGRVINLINAEGGSGDNYTNTVFSSAGVNTLASSAAPFTGTFKPDASAAAAAPAGFTQTDATFASLITNTVNPNGVWSLGAVDGAFGDIGTIVNWTLSLTYNVPGNLPAGLTYAWTPAAGLNNTTTNPVAASPATSTTYTVKVSNAAGCSNTASIAITVNLRPAITAQPLPSITCAGSNATFNVTATGTNITYQWQVSTDNCTTYTNIAGATAATLTVPAVTAAMNNNGYRCIVSGTCPAPAVSNCVKLTVNALPPISITPNITCGGVAGTNGVLLETGGQASPPPIPGSKTFTSGTINVAIPEGNFPAPPATAGVNTITIPTGGIPANATITKISVTSNITHNYVGDVIMVLKNPSGDILNLDGALTGTNNPGSNFVNTVISSDDSKPLLSSWAANGFTSEFRADKEGTTFDVFGFSLAGGPVGYTPTTQTWAPLLTKTPIGAWTVAMYDAGAPDVGNLTSWSIKFDYTTPDPNGAPITYTWSPAAGIYNNTIATDPYITGTQTPHVYAAPTVFTVYTATATSNITGCSNSATAVVNYTPPPPTVTPNPVTKCVTDPAVKLKSSSSSTFVKSFSSGPISVIIPDNSPIGVTTSIPVSGIPANATVTKLDVKLNISHTWAGDMIIALKNPNGTINLDYGLTATGGAGPTIGFVNTVISSAGGAALSSGSGTFTGTFAADKQAAGSNPAPAPNGMTVTTTDFNTLFNPAANINGNYTLGIWDIAAGDQGTITSWSMDFTYYTGVAAQAAVWSPATGLYSDPNASIPYVAGTAIDSVYAKPASTTTYNVTVTSNPPAPLEVATNFVGAFYYSLATFNFTNGNSFPVTITGVSSQFAFGGLVATTNAYYKTSAINGLPGAISTANGWNKIAPTGSVLETTGSNVPFVTGGTVSVPIGATYGIAVECFDLFGGNLLFSDPTPGTYKFTSGGCTITTGDNVSYVGDVAPNAPTFTPYNFMGSVSFLPAISPCTSPARAVTVTVNTPISFPTQPKDAAVCTDKVTSFTDVIAGSVTAHNWRVSTNHGNSWADVADGGVYAGSKTGTLTITAPPLSMNQYLYKDSVHTAGCRDSSSAIVSLTVNPLPTITLSAAPFTKLFPGLRTVVSSTTSPIAATYTWLRNGATVPNATGSTITVGVDGIGDYSVRVTDVNGCTNTSGVLSITDSLNGRVFIYPNPNSGQFQVRYYSAVGNVNIPRGINVYDATGKRVLVQKYSVSAPYARMDVDLRSFGSGVYWIELVDMAGNRLATGRAEVLR